MNLEENKKNAIAFYRMAYEGNPQKSIEFVRCIAEGNRLFNYEPNGT